jgi:hypothetical protein
MFGDTVPIAQWEVFVAGVPNVAVAVESFDQTWVSANFIHGGIFLTDKKLNKNIFEH